MADAMSETPSDPWELRKEANALRKERRYAEAITPYTALWEMQSERDVWDGWGYAFCLDRVGRTSEALNVCRETYKKDPDHLQVRQLYARCVYLLEVKDADGELTRVQKAAKGICKLVKQDDEYAPYVVPAVLTVAKALKQTGRHDDVLNWLERLDASRLSGKPFTFEKNGQTKMGPSDAQRYWLLWCRALHKLGKYAECQEAVKVAIRSLPTFVNDGDVWLQRLAALSLAAEGEAAAGYDALKAILGKKRGWVFEYDLAVIARSLGRRDDAWRHLLGALLERGPIGQRIRAFETASEWLEEEGDKARAAEHLAVVLAIREEEGWAVNDALASRSQALGALPAATVHDGVRALKPLWKKRLDALDPRLIGTITSVIADGRAGFVRTGKGESFYFRAEALRGAHPKVGLAVTFRSAPGFDKKKNEATTVAVDLRMAKS